MLMSSGAHSAVHSAMEAFADLAGPEVDTDQIVRNRCKTHIPLA